jgi:hypothetical protein
LTAFGDRASAFNYVALFDVSSYAARQAAAALNAKKAGVNLLIWERVPTQGDAADSVAEQDVEPLDVEAVCRLFSEQARRGSVPAAKALLQHQWQSERDQAADRELDQLNALAAGR